MKTFFGRTLAPFLPLLLFVATTSSSYAQRTHPRHDAIPHDTARNREARKEFREERRRWMEAMHRADPGVNVHVLNEETRRSKRVLREEKGHVALGDESLVKVTASLGGRWSERGSSNQAGRTLSADIDHATGKIYVAADGGQIWRGTLDGNDWTPLNDDMRFGGVRMLRALRNGGLLRLLVVYGPWVRYSDDDGLNWQNSTGLDDIQRWGGFARGVVTDGPDRIIYALGNEWDYDEAWREFAVLYRSVDFGVSFERVRRFDADLQRMDIWGPPGEDRIYLLHGDTLSTVMPDGTFNTVSTPVEIEGGFAGAGGVSMRGGNAETLYLFVRRGGTTEAHGSPDGGRSWILTGSTTFLFDRNSVAVSPSNPDFLIAGGIETMYSVDAGITWDTVNRWAEYYGDPEGKLHADIPFVGFFPFPDGSEKILISTDGGLYRSDDSLRTVRNLSLHGLGVSQYYSVYTSRTDTNFIFAGSQDQGFQRAELDHGEILPFRQTISGDYGHITSGDNGRSLWTNYPGFSMYYPNALIPDLGWGRSFDFPTHGHMWLPPIVADPDTPTVAYLAGGGIEGGAHLVRLSHHVGSGSFNANELPFDFSDDQGFGHITAFAITPAASGNWYVVTNDTRFFVSTDRGVTWTLTEEFNAPEGHYFYGANIVPSSTTPGLLYVAGAGYSNPGVWISRDNGRTFEAMSEGLPPTLVFDLAASEDNELLFAATAVGPYMYVADSGRWYDIAGGSAPDQTYWSVDYIDVNRVARFGTFGRGIWDFRLSDIPTSVAYDLAFSASSVRLTSHRLDAATTSFRLEIPVDAEVSLRIFDLTGRVVAILHEGRLPAGAHSFLWRGTATEGGPVPAGEYFAVAAVAGTVAYAKAVVVR